MARRRRALRTGRYEFFDRKRLPASIAGWRDREVAVVLADLPVKLGKLAHCSTSPMCLSRGVCSEMHTRPTGLLTFLRRFAIKLSAEYASQHASYRKGGSSCTKNGKEVMLPGK